MKKILLIIVSIIIAGTQFLTANNLSITNVSRSGNDINFNISWENSWYAAVNPGNWDAVWVFIKYKDCATTNWLHANLSANPADHSIGGVLQVDAVPDGKGIFIRRSAAGTGNISSTTATIRLTTPIGGTYDFKVFGVEMVYVPSGDFQIGDGSTFYYTFNSITITSEASVSVGGNYTSDPIPAAYPKGWDSLYCMKYEITQEQYAQFLNTLTYDQQATRIVAPPSNPRGAFALIPNSVYRERNYVLIDTPGIASTTPAVFGCNMDGNRDEITGNNFDDNFNDSDDGQDVACNFLSWYDLIAYLDWAALRPMTDIEFEKICRGFATRQIDEYVWGSRGITQTKTLDIINSGQAGEVTTVTGAGIVVATAGGFNYGPLRVGFAATSTSNRQQSGATYWGAMEMGGNVWERVISTTADGQIFTGTLGDGTLSASGNATNADWPGTSTTKGWGRRGGCYECGNGQIEISDRWGAWREDGSRHNSYGGRGVRR